MPCGGGWYATTRQSCGAGTSTTSCPGVAAGRLAAPCGGPAIGGGPAEAWVRIGPRRVWRCAPELPWLLPSRLQSVLYSFRLDERSRALTEDRREDEAIPSRASSTASTV